MGAPPKKTPVGTQGVSLRGLTPMYLPLRARKRVLQGVCRQGNIHWKKYVGGVSLPPPQQSGELGRGEGSHPELPVLCSLQPFEKSIKGSCWLMPQSHQAQVWGLEAGPRP